MSLLLALCRPQPDPAQIDALVARPIDAAALLRLVHRHRVGALARHGFRLAGVEPPPGIEPALDRQAWNTARQGLLLATETARLTGMLDAAGAAAIVLKGAALAILAHGTLATKSARDIDLLVASDRLAAAAAVMVMAGYRRSGDARTVPLAAWHRFAKDSAWRHPGCGVVVELHTQLTDFPGHLLPGLGAESATQTVELVRGLSVRTFAPEPLFAYLCVHGALSGWRRLKWLADLAGLMRDMDVAGVERLRAVAEELGAGRAAIQAVALSARLLGTPLPPRVAQAVADDRWNRWLISRAQRLLTDQDGFDDPAETVLATLPIHLMALQLKPSRGYRRAVLRRYFRADPRNAGWIPFPLVRLVQQLGRRVRRTAVPR